jgi:hypothetical protein
MQLSTAKKLVRYAKQGGTKIERAAVDSYNPFTNTITLKRGASMETLAHEVGHKRALFKSRYGHNPAMGPVPHPAGLPHVGNTIEAFRGKAAVGKANASLEAALRTGQKRTPNQIRRYGQLETAGRTLVNRQERVANKKATQLLKKIGTAEDVQGFRKSRVGPIQSYRKGRNSSVGRVLTFQALSLHGN